MGVSIDDIIDCFIRLECAIEEGENNQNVDEVYPVLISFKKEHCIEIKEVVDSAIDTMRKYQMFQAKYAERLKADVVAMLTELLMDIEECVDGAEGSPQFEQGVTNARIQVVKMIQERIDNLIKEEIRNGYKI